MRAAPDRSPPWTTHATASLPLYRHAGALVRAASPRLGCMPPAAWQVCRPRRASQQLNEARRNQESKTEPATTTSLEKRLDHILPPSGSGQALHGTGREGHLRCRWPRQGWDTPQAPGQALQDCALLFHAPVCRHRHHLKAPGGGARRLGRATGRWGFKCVAGQVEGSATGTTGGAKTAGRQLGIRCEDQSPSLFAGRHRRGISGSRGISGFRRSLSDRGCHWAGRATGLRLTCPDGSRAGVQDLSPPGPFIRRSNGSHDHAFTSGDDDTFHTARRHFSGLA